jgi:Sigma-70, region 4
MNDTSEAPTQLQKALTPRDQRPLKFSTLRDQIKTVYDAGPSQAWFAGRQTWLGVLSMWIAVEAVRNLDKRGQLPFKCGSGANIDCALVSHGTEVALDALPWLASDPKHRKGHSVEARLLAHVRGRVRNKAWEDNSFGWRQHKPGQVGPVEKMVSQEDDFDTSGDGRTSSDDAGAGDDPYERGTLRVTPEYKSEKYHGVGKPRSFGETKWKWAGSKLYGMSEDGHIANAANRAAKGSGKAVARGELFKWTKTSGPPPRGPSELKINIRQILAVLPPQDREILTKYFGVGDVTQATVSELATLGGCSESTVRRRLEAVLEEALVIAKKYHIRPNTSYTGRRPARRRRKAAARIVGESMSRSTANGMSGASACSNPEATFRSHEGIALRSNEPAANGVQLGASAERKL